MISNYIPSHHVIVSLGLVYDMKRRFLLSSNDRSQAFTVSSLNLLFCTRLESIFFRLFFNSSAITHYHCFHLLIPTIPCHHFCQPLSPIVTYHHLLRIAIINHNQHLQSVLNPCHLSSDIAHHLHHSSAIIHNQLFEYTIFHFP